MNESEKEKLEELTEELAEAIKQGIKEMVFLRMEIVELEQSKKEAKKNE